jgi:hypothetical protein
MKVTVMPENSLIVPCIVPATPPHANYLYSNFGQDFTTIIVTQYDFFAPNCVSLSPSLAIPSSVYCEMKILITDIKKQNLS